MHGHGSCIWPLTFQGHPWTCGVRHHYSPARRRGDRHSGWRHLQKVNQMQKHPVIFGINFLSKSIVSVYFYVYWNDERQNLKCTGNFALTIPSSGISCCKGHANHKMSDVIYETIRSPTFRPLISHLTHALSPQLMMLGGLVPQQVLVRKCGIHTLSCSLPCIGQMLVVVTCSYHGDINAILLLWLHLWS